MSSSIEMKIYGLNACLAIFAQRPQALIRVYLTEYRLKQLSTLLKFCAQKKLAYHVVSDEELEKISQSAHHEGVCLLVRRLKRASLTELKLLVEKPGVWLALEQVGNPHNLGAIVRTCAHFGAQGIFLIGENASWQNGAFYRTAEGGAEAIMIYPFKNMDEFKEKVATLGFTVFSTSGHQGQSLFACALPKRAVFLLGSEGEGLSKKALVTFSKALRIPGTGAVESLNVSVAAAIFISEWSRQHTPVA